MKFYILDLVAAQLAGPVPGRAQGHTVFMVSWRNPGAEDRDLTMEDYVELGVFESLAAVHRRYRAPASTRSATAWAGRCWRSRRRRWARDDHAPIRDGQPAGGAGRLSGAGRIGPVHRREPDRVPRRPDGEHGYLDGRQMAGAFSLINSKDLVWSKLVHEYLMGAQTPMTDLRAWNADATRLPARMHGEYLRKLYLNNDLAEGRYPMRGRPAVLTDIQVADVRGGHRARPRVAVAVRSTRSSPVHRTESASCSPSAATTWESSIRPRADGPSAGAAIASRRTAHCAAPRRSAGLVRRRDHARGLVVAALAAVVARALVGDSQGATGDRAAARRQGHRGAGHLCPSAMTLAPRAARTVGGRGDAGRVRIWRGKRRPAAGKAG